jgi:hypothetical protein
MRTLAIAASLVALTVSAEERVTSRFQSEVPRGSLRRVVVDIPAGDITIRNGSADRLVVSGTVSREPDSDRSRKKEQRIVNHTAVEIVVRNDEAVVQRKFGPDANTWRAKAFSDYDVTLEVPPGLNLDIKTEAGEVRVDGSFGDIEIDMTAGEVDLRLPRKDVRELRASCRAGEVRTNIGNEIIEKEGLFPGRTRYINPDGRSFVNVHVTFGEVDVMLR